MTKFIDMFGGWEKLTHRFSAAVLYGITSAFALNFFYQPGRVYASGATGAAQVTTEILTRILGHNYLPISATLFLINVPLMILAWFRLGKQFTLFTLLTVTMSSVFIHFVPETTLTPDPIINAIFGGTIMGAGVGYAMRNGISSGGTDIIALYIRKKTGHNVGTLGFIVNGVIIFTAGVLFGWEYMLYSMIAIFVSSRVTDAIFTRQKRMQVMIVTENPEIIIRKLFEKMRHSATILNNAEGAYSHEKRTILFTVITMYEYQDFKEIITKYDPKAFVSISENVRVIGNFSEITD